MNCGCILNFQMWIDSSGAVYYKSWDEFWSNFTQKIFGSQRTTYSFSVRFRMNSDNFNEWTRCSLRMNSDNFKKFHPVELWMNSELLSVGRTWDLSQKKQYLSLRTWKRILSDVNMYSVNFCLLIQKKCVTNSWQGGY